MSRDRNDYRCLAVLVCGVALGCQFKIEPDESNDQLGDTLRVLAIRSEPADVAPTETAEFEALVYAPQGCSVDDAAEYSWSWCPLRDPSDLSCAIAEDDAREAWEAQQLDAPFPSYALGAAEIGAFTHALPAESATLLCALPKGPGRDTSDAAFDACLAEIGLSVRVSVTRCGQTAVAVKRVPLVAEDAEYRNTNPNPAGPLTFRTADADTPLDAGAALTAGINYIGRAEYEVPVECPTDDPAAPCQSELFVDEDKSEGGEPTTRSEELRASWYLTKGRATLEEVTQSLGGFGETINGFGLPDPAESYVVLENESEPGDERLFILLFDERGGVGWAEHAFRVEPTE